jgi:hypothetical protein
VNSSLLRCPSRLAAVRTRAARFMGNEHSREGRVPKCCVSQMRLRILGNSQPGIAGRLYVPVLIRFSA